MRFSSQWKNKIHRISVILMALSMIITMMPFHGSGQAYAAESDISQQTREVVLTASDSDSEFSTSTFNEGGVRSTAKDRDGNLWVGTYGGGLSYKAKDSDEFVTYNKSSEPALASATVSAVCPDANGGVWFTQNADDPHPNNGVAYMKDGNLTYYRAHDVPATIPDDNVQEVKIDKAGNVWFGSSGGLTKYDPKAGTWQTWDVDDGFPAMSVDKIEFDKDGGIWCGFYPDSESYGGAYVGGFAYFKDGEVVKQYQYTSEQDVNTGGYRLADVWVRDIAVDADGGTWIVASGSYGGMENRGGKVWYVDAPGNPAKEYTGFDLFGEGNFQTDSELRMVAIDPDGGLWFGTSMDGIFYVADPMIIGGQLMLTEMFSSAEKSWTAEQFDDIYSLDFYGKTLYAGSKAGLATRTFEFENNEEEIHEHSYSKNWSKNSEYHWHAATCEHTDLTNGYAKHNYDAGTISKGVKTYTCQSCGYQKKETLKVTVPKTSIKSVKRAKKAFTLKWTKKSVTGYQIQYATNSKFTKGKKTIKVIKAAIVSKKISKLKGKKKYYVRVRCYINKYGKTYYSGWSAKKKVTTK